MPTSVLHPHFVAVVKGGDKPPIDLSLVVVARDPSEGLVLDALPSDRGRDDVGLVAVHDGCHVHLLFGDAVDESVSHHTPNGNEDVVKADLIVRKVSQVGSLADVGNHVGSDGVSDLGIQLGVASEQSGEDGTGLHFHYGNLLFRHIVMCCWFVYRYIKNRAKGRDWCYSSVGTWHVPRKTPSSLYISNNGLMWAMPSVTLNVTRMLL